MTSANDLTAAGGRVLMSVIFLISGVEKLVGFTGTVGAMAGHGLPVPAAAAALAVVVECGGGLLILIGYQTRAAGLILAVWCIATALVAHTHFSAPGQEVNFLKNLAMCGGFLQLVAFGGGTWSLDARGVRRPHASPA